MLSTQRVEVWRGDGVDWAQPSYSVLFVLPNQHPLCKALSLHLSFQPKCMLLCLKRPRSVKHRQESAKSHSFMIKVEARQEEIGWQLQNGGNLACTLHTDRQRVDFVAAQIATRQRRCLLDWKSFSFEYERVQSCLFFYAYSFPRRIL